MRAVWSTIAVLVASPAMAAPGCHVDNYRFVFGQDASATMTAKSGMACTSKINAGVSSSTIAQPPANGTASAPDPHHWTYQSRRGFTGNDAFVVAIEGTSTSNKFGRSFSGTTRIAVNVIVAP